MMNFHCPDFYHHFFLYKELLFLYYNHNECFKDNIQIKSIFGMFPGASWNGGTYDDSEKINEDEVKYNCTYNYNSPFPFFETRKNRILPEEVNQYYESGFSEFKISGRLYKENAVITMVPYLIK